MRSTIDPARLRTDPGTSTKRQHQALVIEAANRGFDLAEVRRLVGGSLRALSAKQCSDWIAHFSGKGLPHPPGRAPRPYARRRSGGRGSRRAAIPRIIARSHMDQITRLLLDYFGNFQAARVWFQKTWKVDSPPDLLTADRAGQVIAVLKDMLARRSEPRSEPRPSGSGVPSS